MKFTLKIQVFVSLLASVCFCCCCRKDIPAVTTASISEFTETTAISGGNVTDNGGADVTARGVCWNTSKNPTMSDSKTSDGTGNGVFTSNITGLNSNTTYYIRAYATNSEGTGYGNEIPLTTKSSTVQDIDGNIYNTVQIGSQVWMKENLKTTRFNNGSSIPLVSDNTSWSNLISSGYCWFQNDAPAYGGTYGALYNWYAVSSGNLCPVGWHIPSDAEWTALTNYLGGMSTSGSKMKEAGSTHWISYPGIFATNESGFTGLPGAYRDRAGGFYSTVGHYGFWWSSTEVSSTNAWDRGLYYDKNDVSRGDGWKPNGISVRCIKN